MLTSEEIGNRLKRKNVKLLSLYSGTNAKHKLLCLNCKFRWNTTLKKSQGACPKCGRIRSVSSHALPREEVRRRLAKVDLKILDRYTGVEKLHRIECLKCNHIWKTRLVTHVTMGCRCPECANQLNGDRQKSPEEKVRLELKKRGIVLIGPYPGKWKPNLFRCSKEHTWSSKAGIILKGRGCPTCSLQEQEKKVRSRLSQFGIELIGEYSGTRNEVELRCNRCRHEWKGMWFLKSCPRCGKKELASETMVRKILEKLTKRKFKKAKPSWTKGNGKMPLELDGFNKDLNLAFEYQGQQHYKPISFGKEIRGANFKLRRQQLNDKRKKFLCKSHGVFLICVPYWVEDIESFLKKKLKNYCEQTGHVFTNCPLS